MWEVIKNSQGLWHALPNLPPFDQMKDADEFAQRLANSNSRTPPLKLAVRPLDSTNQSNAHPT